MPHILWSRTRVHPSALPAEGCTGPGGRMFPRGFLVAYLLRILTGAV